MKAKVNAALVVMSLTFASRIQAQSPHSLSAERLRLAEITGDSLAAADSTLTQRIRIPVGSWLSMYRRTVVFDVPPEARITWNSSIPFSLNDGPMWAGRGKSLSFSAGIGIQDDELRPRFRLVVAPTLVYSENLPFQVIPSGISGRSSYASPFHDRLHSADLPLRFGDRHVLRLDPGRTALNLRINRLALGIASDNEIWGPGIRNQLILSANAAGIPRVYVRTDAPVRTRFGLLEGRLFSGVLTESSFFDDFKADDLRALNGVNVQLRPSFDTTLTIGLERVVYSPIQSAFTGPLGHALDVFLRWEYLAPPGDDRPDGRPNQRADQIIGLFARWVFPKSGFEVYGEWARMELPHSLTELLTATHHTLGYTLGFQWAEPRSRHSYLRLQSEVTNLEQSRVFSDRPPPDIYTGRVSAQGYTQRGQIIGAAIGPGASSQWIAVDYIAPRWQFGVFAGRIRWENDALYRQPIPTLFSHDVTVQTGLRGARRTSFTDISLDGTFGYRFNYLFQNGFAQPSGYAFRTVDVRNFTMSMALTPR
jgi:hypothetical protein